MTDAPAERAGEGALSKLRHRKVVQWGLAYAAAAWTLLQVIEYLGETYSWPPAIRQIATPALALGLPFVLVLAWYHGDKGEQKLSRPELAILATLIAIVSSTLWWYVSRLDETVWGTQSPEPMINNTALADPASIAVLPFVDLSPGKDQEYFADGMSEEVLNVLTQLPQLRVIARTSSFSFKDKSIDVATIAAALNVAHVLEGSVRKSGDTVRITVQLIRASDSSQLWSQTYDRKLNDVFKVQDEIAGAVVAALKVKLLPAQQLTRAHRTENTAAYNQYLLGNHFLHLDTVDGYRNAVSAYRQAVALDPGYAAAFARLAIAEYYAAEYTDTVADLQAGKQRAVAAADNAVALAPDLADGYSARGWIRNFWAWDWNGAGADLEKALALDPGNGESQQYYGDLLGSLGRVQEAIVMYKKAIELDPLSAWAWASFARYYYSDGQWQSAREALNRSLAINPDSMHGNARLGTLELLQGRPQDALAAFHKVGSYLGLDGVAMAEYSLGHERESQQALDELLALDSAFHAYQVARVYAWRGEKDRAFEWLERAYEDRDSGLAYSIKTDRLLDSLRTDPRYAAMLKKLGLPP